MFAVIAAALIVTSWPYWFADGFIVRNSLSSSLHDAVFYTLGASGVFVVCALSGWVALRFCASAEEPPTQPPRRKNWFFLLLPLLGPAERIAIHSATPLIAIARIGCLVLWLVLTCVVSGLLLSRLAPECLDDRWKRRFGPSDA